MKRVRMLRARSQHHYCRGLIPESVMTWLLHVKFKCFVASCQASWWHPERQYDHWKVWKSLPCRKTKEVRRVNYHCTNALEMMEKLMVSSLACVICYNDYGVESPEGVNEAPLRLPPCKHIFGDHCIRKWLEESDSCPYCRAKLQAEPRHSYGSATTFIDMMRLRGLPLPAG